MTCKGICVRYKAQKPVGTGRYASGQRRCQICEIFIKWEGLWCPCCGYRLRTKPRNLKYKAKLRARVEADSIEAKAIAQEKQEEIVEEVVAVKVKAKAAKTTVKAKAAKTTVKAKAAKTTVKAKAAKTTVKAKAAKTTVKAKAAKTRKTKAKDLPKTESIAIKA
jgi:hypothetical protein